MKKLIHCRFLIPICRKVGLVCAFLISSHLANAQYTKLFDFAGTSNGALPYGDLISDGTFLYGMTYQGGTNNLGTIFKIKPDGTGYAKLLDFANTPNGYYPVGSLFSVGTFLYGMTGAGGTSDNGIIFKIKPDGSGYMKLLDFNDTTSGSVPNGSFIYDGTFLYGMTYAGGINSMGTIFKIMPDGSGYMKLLDFAGPINGAYPNGSLIYDGIFLYGMTNSGGANDKGTIFKIMPDGSGYVKLFDFSTADGSYPYGSLITDGTFLYGMTEYGGTYNKGTIFKIMPDGSGYMQLLNFAGNANGKFPHGSLMYDGTFLFGMTTNGGIYYYVNLDTAFLYIDTLTHDGTIFKIMPDGSGYVKLFDCDSIDGIWPYGDLISDGTFLYGMTFLGGVNNMGTIFKYKYSFIGIEENDEDDNIEIFPNPANEWVQVHFMNEFTIGNYEIVDITGKTIVKSMLQYSESVPIKTDQLSPGTYFIKFNLDGQFGVKKLFKE